MKKYKVSPVSIIAYVVAALLLVNFGVSAAQTVSQVNQYYAQYGMTPGFSEVVSYVMQNGLTPLVLAFLSFLGGYTLSQVWKLNPDHVKTVAEVAGVVEVADVAEAAAEKVKEVAEEAVEAVAETAEKAEETVEEVAEEVAEEVEEAVADAE